ncbi:hypothetical protein DERF_015003 [Dermatophagoides farinae]|uniref:Uncharacterized protein n=1 Tax=Dermatophagoides farinae TaxID=6954 RepID=A0A922L1T3_DERFA|nr:hypothetical protein DERF_015003 [Dermatophagoides farinae]
MKSNTNRIANDCSQTTTTTVTTTVTKISKYIPILFHSNIETIFMCMVKERKSRKSFLTIRSSHFHYDYFYFFFVVNDKFRAVFGFAVFP